MVRADDLGLEPDAVGVAQPDEQRHRPGVGRPAASTRSLRARSTWSTGCTRSNALVPTSSSARRSRASSRRRGSRTSARPDASTTAMSRGRRRTQRARDPINPRTLRASRREKSSSAARPGRAAEVALERVAPELFEAGELRRSLDAFGDDAELQRAREADDGAHDGFAAVVLVEALTNERSIFSISTGNAWRYASDE